MLPDHDLNTRTLARREAVHSSQIEGTCTQLPELFESEATGGERDLNAWPLGCHVYSIGLRLLSNTLSKNQKGQRYAGLAH